MKDLLKIRAWFKSKTLKFFGIAGGISAIDATFFEGDVGMFILQIFLTLANTLPFLDLTAEQGISALVVLISGVGVWLRSVTSQPLGDK